MLVLTNVPNPVSPVPPALVEQETSGSGVISNGFRMNLLTFGIGFEVTPALPGTKVGGSVFPDFPSTPRAPEMWLLGCIQNVIKQSIDVTWIDNSGKEKTDSFSTARMLDGDPGVQLPFVRMENGGGIDPCTRGLLYGLRGSPIGNPQVDASIGPGPAWDIQSLGFNKGPFNLIATDAPSIFVFAFKGGSAVSGSANPIIEVKRSLTLQIWLTAVPATGMKDPAKHNILGFTDEFTVEGKYDRRANSSNLAFFHFEPADFTRTAITPTSNVGNKTPPKNRPMISGALSVDPVKNWLKTNGFA